MANYLDELAKFEQEIQSLSQGASGGKTKGTTTTTEVIKRTAVKVGPSRGQETTVVKTVKAVQPIVSYASAPVPAKEGSIHDAAALAKAALSRVNSTLAAVGGLSNVVQNTVPPPPLPPPLPGSEWSRGAPPPPPPPHESSRSSKSSKSKQPERKRYMRTAAGEVWEDKSLSDWPEKDFRLFCGDLGNEVNDTVLAKAFAKYSSFAKAKVIRNKKTQKSKGYGFVSFLDPFDCAAALREVNGKYVGNRPIKLRRSAWQQRELNDVTKKKRKALKKGMPVKIKNSRMRF
eukprot:CAMPEP_0114524500 /NCGR_PEP_ID=MMETSP0109-20121206/21892_1 /TAXON_ID=29199 /ORGANISM="Chlorarachnion reptans, Strain CCCM449" /LENGTH=287 /DNA_ID=CAMNT_0001705955 /DNA_START=12 /DNA_END=875 /DNA_ORIENTATION=-